MYANKIRFLGLSGSVRRSPTSVTSQLGCSAARMDHGHGHPTIVGMLTWLVVGPPLWKIWVNWPIGMIRNPIYGKIKLMFQTTNQLLVGFKIPRGRVFERMTRPTIPYSWWYGPPPRWVYHLPSTEKSSTSARLLGAGCRPLSLYKRSKTSLDLISYRYIIHFNHSP